MMHRTPVRDVQVEQAQNGSVEAFELIVRSHQRDVRAFVARHISDLHVADEVAQEVFIAAFRSLSQFRGTSSVRAWLLGIARHHVISWFRKKKSATVQNLERQLDDAVLCSLIGEQFDAEAEARRIEALRGCIQSLDSAGRDMIVQFYYRSESAEEISERLGKPAGTIRMALLRIRKRLRLCIEGKLLSRGDLP